VLATRVNLYGVRGVAYFDFNDMAAENFEWNDKCLDFIEFGAARRPDLDKFRRARCAEQLDGPELSRWRWWLFPDAADDPYDFPEDTTPKGKPMRMWSGNPNGPHLRRTKDIYGADCFAYESVMICYLALHLEGNIGHYKTIRTELAFSRDGFQYSRVPARQRRGLFPEHAACPNVHWMRCEPVGGGPAIIDEKLVFHTACFDASAAKSRDIRRQKRSRSLEVFTMRRDGFASVSGTGVLLTRKLTVAHSALGGRGRLFVNGRPTKPGGELSVSAQWEGGAPIAIGTVHEDATSYMVEGRCGKACNTEWPHAFELQFKLTNFEMFSFWIAEREGHSYGHFTVGGPHYPHGRDAGKSDGRD